MQSALPQDTTIEKEGIRYESRTAAGREVHWEKGELVNVSDGYARTSCCPASWPKEANAQAMNELKNAEAAKAYKVKTETEHAQRAPTPSPARW